MALSKAYYDISQIIFDGSSSQIETYQENQSSATLYACRDMDNELTSVYGDLYFSPINNIYKETINGFEPVLITGKLTWADSTQTKIIQVLGNSVSTENINTDKFKYKHSASNVLATITVRKDVTFSVSFIPDQRYSVIILALKDRSANDTLRVNDSTSFTYNNIINLLNKLNISNGATKIGFQGVPGTLLNINGNNIIVGMSGQYELYHPSLTIYSLGVIPKINEPFIITLKYQR